MLILNELKSYHSFEGHDDDDDYAYAKNIQLRKLKVQQLKAIENAVQSILNDQKKKKNDDGEGEEC